MVCIFTFLKLYPWFNLGIISSFCFNVDDFRKILSPTNLAFTHRPEFHICILEVPEYVIHVALVPIFSFTRINFFLFIQYLHYFDEFPLKLRLEFLI